MKVGSVPADDPATVAVAPKELFELEFLTQDDGIILSENDLSLARYGVAQGTE